MYYFLLFLDIEPTKLIRQYHRQVQSKIIVREDGTGQELSVAVEGASQNFFGSINTLTLCGNKKAR